MKYLKYLVLIVILVALAFVGYKFLNPPAEDAVKIIRNLPVKEVEVFDLSSDETKLILTKSGKSAADITANVTPQISGRVVGINYKVGDSVKKNDILIKLGESLSTGTIDTQYSSSKASEEIAQESQNATEYATDNSIKIAEISAESAIVGYNNALEIKSRTQKSLGFQIESAELNVDALYDTIDDLEEQLDDLQDADADQASIDQVEKAIDTTERQLDQAKIAVDQTRAAYSIQLQQLNNAVVSAKTQCEIALRQVESAKAAAILQRLQSQGQVIQAQTSKIISEMQFNEKNIKAPISGVITSISIEEGNIVSPGQVIVKVEKTDKLAVKTSLNENEARFVRVDDEVEIVIDEQEVEGRVVSISPSLNSQSKKIDVEIEIDNNSITAGSFAEVNFIVHPAGRIFIPVNAIYLKGTSKYVWAINKEDKTELIQISTGEIIGDFIEVKEGLKGNEKIIRTTSNFLIEGEKVKAASK